MSPARCLTAAAALAACLDLSVPAAHAEPEGTDPGPRDSLHEPGHRDFPHEPGHRDFPHEPVEREPEPGEEKVLSFGVDELVVTASPLAKTAAQVATGISIIDQKQLLMAQQPTLGETLKFVPGVASSYYGPGSSRPIIRGLGGPRVGILENSLTNIDASAASADHAVTIDPLALERVEILRGPATLRFGPNAVGGVVNSIDERVPTERRDELLSGRVELRGASVNGSFGGAAVLEGGSGNLAYYLSGFGLDAGDLSIPGDARSAQLRAIDPLPPGEAEPRGTLPNSAVENNGFATGLSWVGDDFYFGVAPSLYRTKYGTVAEPDVTVDLASNRLDVQAGVSEPFALLHSIDAKARVVDYHHQELEGDEVGTRFSNQGYDLRIEAVHHPLGWFDGALGFQSQRSDFSALGEEAFIPATLTNTQSGFVIEDLHFEPVTIEIGGRIDYTTIDSAGGEAFGPPDDRSFVTGSGAASLIWDLFEDQSLGLNAAYTQRPPNYEELYANGPHVAIDRFEIGDPNFSPERSLGFNLSYLGSYDEFVWGVNGYYNRFWNFLTLFPTGEERDGLPVEVFRGIPAYFAGGEVELAYHLIDDGVQSLHLIARADFVYAENRDDGAPLPRIPPARFGGSVVYDYDVLHTQLDVMRAQAQNRVPEDALPTDGYLMLDLGATYELPVVGPFAPLLFFKISNLLDQDARDAASFLKDVAPFPGRNFSGGVQFRF